ncbi:MAG TPA: hypothetical protein VFO16_18355, partial [Pseudonocardiaceae bacterium]|nr:hypothetical protein [Pseudonocardiaceae bacterium]
MPRPTSELGVSRHALFRTSRAEQVQLLGVRPSRVLEDPRHREPFLEYPCHRPSCQDVSRSTTPGDSSPSRTSM